MTNSFIFVFSFILSGLSFGLTSFAFFDANIGPCIKNACPLSYECKNEFCIFVNQDLNEQLTTFQKYNDDTTTVSSSDIPASDETITPSITFSTLSPFDSQITDSILSDISADNSMSSKGGVSSTDTPANIPLASFSSQESYTSVSSTIVSASATETDGFSLSVSSLASTDTPLSLSTTAITTKSTFDFKIPCFFGFCLNEYVCKNFWCVRSNSTSFSTTIFTSEAPASESTVTPRFETANPTVITGPCIENLCPNNEEVCKNGLCAKFSTLVPEFACNDKRYGCELISYLCNIFNDTMTENCAKTCKKC